MDFQSINWASWFPSIIAAGALGMVWADMRRFKKTISEQFAKLQSDFKKSLYGVDGITRYVPRGECENQATKCQNMLCGKIDELKTVQKDADKKRQDARKDNQEQMERISKHMGQVERYMLDHP